MLDDVSQRLYISACLGNPSLFSRVIHLIQPSYFDVHLQPCVAFMKEFYIKQRGVPSLPVFQAATKIKDLEATVLPKQDIQFVAEQLAEFCQTRAVIEAVLKAPALLESRDFGALVNNIKLAAQVQLHSDLGIEYFKDPEQRLAMNEEFEELIPLGWAGVDEMIGGGLGRQELLLFTANSGGGKSVAMLNVGVNLLKRGMNGVYISLEMRDRVVAKRADSMISKITGSKINFNKLKVGQEVEAAARSGYGRFFIKRMKEGSTNADHITSYLRELEAVHGFKPDFVIVDYIDLMASIQKHGGDNMFTKDKFVTEEVRGIGFDFDCLMISASQLGRAAIAQSRDNKQLGQDHIQGGMSKINTSDLVIALVKDEATGLYRFEFLKSRNSAAVNKTIEMGWDPDTLTISDLAIKLFQKPKRDLTVPSKVPGSSDGTLEDLLKS